MEIDFAFLCLNVLVNSSEIVLNKSWFKEAEVSIIKRIKTLQHVTQRGFVTIHQSNSRKSSGCEVKQRW